MNKPDGEEKMKATAIILVILCLAAFVGIGYLYMSAVIEVDSVELVAYEASTQQALFDDLKEQTAESRLIGTMFAEAMPDRSDEQVFLQYTVNIRNNTFLKVEEAEIQITPLPGDVLQVGEPQPVDIPAHGNGGVSTTLLTSAGAKSIRELTVTYYVWGLPFKTRTTYGR